MIIDDFILHDNKLNLIQCASIMIKEKYANLYSNGSEIGFIIDNITTDIYNNYKNNNNVNIYELNKIALKYVKNFYENKNKDIELDNNSNKVNEKINNIIEHIDNNDNNNLEQINKNNNISLKEEGILDNDVLNKKLRELEISRRIMSNNPNVYNQYLNNKDNKDNKDIQDNILENNKNKNNIYHYNNDLNLFNNIKIYKNYVLSSINRDWWNIYIDRNNIIFNIPIDIKNYNIIPECLTLSKNIKYITPYIILNISDNIKNINYIFICDKINGNWDTWRLSSENNDIEYIELNKNWKLTLYDYSNRILDLGSDNYNILNVINEDKYYKLSINLNNNILNVNDNIIIKTYNSKLHYKKIDKIINNFYYITNDNILLEDFINCKILNMMEQYSFIIKYCSKI
jgi:hypothetical protein